MCTRSSENIQDNKKRLQTSEEVEKYFPGFLSFIDCTEQEPIPRPVDKRRCKICYLGKKKGHTVKTQLMVNNRGLVIHKTSYKKGKRHMSTIFIRRIILPPPKQVVTVVIDLG